MGSSCGTSIPCTYKTKRSSLLITQHTVKMCHQDCTSEENEEAPHLLLMVRRVPLLRGSRTAQCANCPVGSGIFVSQLRASIAGFCGKALQVSTTFPSFFSKGRHNAAGKCFQQFPLPMSHAPLGLELCKHPSESLGGFHRKLLTKQLLQWK